MILDRFRLSDKVAIVTGAGRGIGRGIALGLAEAGASVVCAARTAAAIEEVAQAIRGAGGRALAVPCDVNDRAQLEDVVSKTLKEFGGVDIVVNNAGGSPPSGALKTSERAFEQAFHFNVTTAFSLTRLAAPHMFERGGGSIVNISSTAGLTAHDDAAYTASKWGLRGLTKTAVLQFSPWKIRVNSIHPGQIADTGFFRSAGDAFAHAARTAIPLNRQGTPKECAELVLFLASEEASFISGAEIAIDGGYIAAGLGHMRNLFRDQYAAGNAAKP
ncbi:MAG TPA: short-chain dehydrogenase [Deltaproteobacteria bacterium]|nr:short-chain dehydrogenase [Deltaproteobacteria bacterium]